MYEVFKDQTNSACSIIVPLVVLVVLICVTKRLISDPVPELETDCEILWVKINLVGVNSLLVEAFYRPHMQDDKAIE